MTPSSQDGQGDRAILKQMEPLVDDLWKPLRFLADLRSIWIDLEPRERQRIEESRPFRERHHERLAHAYADQLMQKAQQLRESRHSELRDELLQYLEYWEEQEPDKLKVVSAMIRTELAAGSGPLP